MEEFALNFLPKKKNKLDSRASPRNHNFMRKASEDLQKKNSIYAHSPTTINKRRLVNTRDQLQTAYETATVEIMQHKINDIYCSPAQYNPRWENHQQNHSKEEETKKVKGKTS